MIAKQPKSYGLPYKGSKNLLARRIVDAMPPGAALVDIFAGGCAVAHAALISRKWTRVVANDLTDMPRLFKDAIAGKYHNESRWISRDDFAALKDTDPYVRTCWSFGNDNHTYLYGREIEPYKRALHYAVIFDIWQPLQELCPEVCEAARHALLDLSSFLARRVAIGRAIAGWLRMRGTPEMIAANPLYRSVKTRKKTDGQSLQRLQSLERLQSLQSLQRLTVSQEDYREVPIPPGAIIYCFDKATEILTNNGWVNVSDVSIGDRCLSREPNGATLEWVNVVKTISYRHTGKMYRYAGKNVDLCVTPNHRMLVNVPHARSKKFQDEFITAEDLCRAPDGKRFVSAGGVWHSADEAETVEICGESFDKGDFAWLLGLFLTDGCVNNKGIITISQTKPAIVAKLRDTLKRMAISHSEYRHGERGNITFYIPMKYLPFFRQFYLKDERHIPAEIKDWGAKYLERLIEGCVDGDGDCGKRKIYCGSKTLVDDMQEVCYKIGLSANVKAMPPKDSYLKEEDRWIHGQKPYYVLSINHKPYLSVIRGNQSMIDYDGMVNCVTLAKWHTVLVRRNGKPIWCGQCDPPYKDTGGYNGQGFDHEAFYDWADSQAAPVFISEYTMPPDRFECVAAWPHRSRLAQKTNKPVMEKLFVQRRFAGKYNEMAKQQDNSARQQPLQLDIFKPAM